MKQSNNHVTDFKQIKRRIHNPFKYQNRSQSQKQSTTLNH